MAVRTSSLHSSADDGAQVESGGRVYKVKKPASNSSREVRDAVLRDYFGYTDADIKELDNEKPGGVFYLRDSKGKYDWATPDEVKGWKVDPVDNLLPVPLTSFWVKTLTDFRGRRVTIVINQAVGAISDSELRGKVAGYLQKLFSQAESERLTALNDLLNETGGSLDSSSQISAALSHLTDKAGYQDNPLLVLVKANAAFTEYRKRSGPGYDIDARTLLAEAVRKANSNFIFGSDQSPLSLSRGEAAFVSRQASFLYNQLGDNKEARERDWAARFYEMGDGERAELDEGDIIEFISPVEAMSKPQPPTATRKKLDDLEARRKETVEAQDKIDKIGSQIVPTDHRAGEYYQSPNDSYEAQKLRRGDRRVNQSRKSVRYRVVTLNENPYSKANVYSDGYGAMLELPLKIAKAGNILRRLAETTSYLNKRDYLLRRIRSENRYVVPPKPAEVEKLVKQVQSFGRITANPYEKNQTLITLRDLERLWEESNAFWKNRK